MRAIFTPIAVVAIACAALGQEFEVVSLKPNNSGPGHSDSDSNQGRLTATNVSVKSMIEMAYELRDYQVEGPAWLGSQRFDVSAKFPANFPKEREKYSAALGVMMQKMLTDRFKLTVHREEKSFSVYALVVAKGGIKFKEVPESGSHNSSSRNNHYAGTCVSMATFAGFLTRRRVEFPADRPVVDMTGLKGFYDLTLDWVPEPKQPAEGKGDLPVLADASGLTLPLALQEQLGLRVETRKAPIEVLVVDSAEKTPTEN